MGGHDLEFTTPNYHIITTPKDEWRLLAERRARSFKAFEEWLGEQDRKVGLGQGHHGRRIPNVDELLQLESSAKAGLQEAEVLAIVLYTGPMVSRAWSPPRRVAPLHSRVGLSGPANLPGLAALHPAGQTQGFMRAASS